MSDKKKVRDAIKRGLAKFQKIIISEKKEQGLQDIEEKRIAQKCRVMLRPTIPQAEEVADYIKTITEETKAIRCMLFVNDKVPWVQGRVCEGHKDVRDKIHPNYLVADTESSMGEEFIGYQWSLHSNLKTTPSVYIFLTAGNDLSPLYILKYCYGPESPRFETFSNPKNLFETLLKFVEEAIAKRGTTPMC